jgi:hypothetical protein
LKGRKEGEGGVWKETKEDEGGGRREVKEEGKGGGNGGRGRRAS